MRQIKNGPFFFVLMRADRERLLRNYFVKPRKGMAGSFSARTIREALRRLTGSEIVKKVLAEQKRIEEKEERLQKSSLQTLDSFRVSSEIPFAGKLRNDLNISRLQKEIKEKREKSSEGLMLQRVLEGIFAQTSFYLPTHFLEQKNFDRSCGSVPRL
jgi:hypothetical protein